MCLLSKLSDQIYIFITKHANWHRRAHNEAAYLRQQGDDAVTNLTNTLLLSSLLRVHMEASKSEHCANIYPTTGTQSSTGERGSGSFTIWWGTWALPVCPWSRWCIQAQDKCWGWQGRPSGRRLAPGSAQCEPAVETAYRTEENDKHVAVRGNHKDKNEL